MVGVGEVTYVWLEPCVPPRTSGREPLGGGTGRWGGDRHEKTGVLTRPGRYARVLLAFLTRPHRARLFKVCVPHRVRRPCRRK